MWVLVKGTGISGRVGDTPLESFVLAVTSHSTGGREAARAAESCFTGGRGARRSSSCWVCVVGKHGSRMKWFQCEGKLI